MLFAACFVRMWFEARSTSLWCVYESKACRYAHIYIQPTYMRSYYNVCLTHSSIWCGGRPLFKLAVQRLHQRHWYVTSWWTVVPAKTRPSPSACTCLPFLWSQHSSACTICSQWATTSASCWWTRTAGDTSSNWTLISIEGLLRSIARAPMWMTESVSQSASRWLKDSTWCYGIICLNKRRCLVLYVVK